MSKGWFVLVTIGLSVIVVFLWLMTVAVRIRNEEAARPTPTPTPIPSPTPITDVRPTARPTLPPATPLALVESTPEDGATNVPIDTKIVATFNMTLSGREYIFSILPDARYSLIPFGNTLTVEFTEPLQPDTEYTYSINTLQQLRRVFTFRTAPASSTELQQGTREPRETMR